MKAPEIDLVRGAALAPEFRADDAGAEVLGRMVGYFSASNVWYEVDSFFEGLFLERTAQDAFDDTIANDRDDMRVLFDHGFDSIGNKVLGPIDVLEPRAKGPYYEVPLFDTSYNRDLLPGLRAGVYGASMRMRVLAEEWDDEPRPSRANPKGIPERTITRARVMEFGPVTFPANPKASASVRSLTDSYYDRLRQRDAGAYEDAVRAAGREIPGLTGRPGARSAGGGDSGTEPTRGEVPTVHSTRQRLDDGALRLRRILT